MNESRRNKCFGQHHLITFNPSLVQSYSGGAPDQLSEFISKCLNEHCKDGGGPLSLLMKIAAAAALVAGGAALAARLNVGNSGGGGSETSPSSRLLELKQRLVSAQARLRTLEKANRGKQARAQRKLIEQLHAELRALERVQGQSGTKTSGKNGSGGDGTTSGSTGRRAGAAGQGNSAGDGTQGRSGGRRLSGDDLARIRWRKRRGEVLYSDEEDAMVAADGA